MARRKGKKGRSFAITPADVEKMMQMTGEALGKLTEAAKGTSDQFGKFASGMKDFLMAPAMNNLKELLGNIQSINTSIFGASAQAAGFPGAKEIRRFAGDVAATAATGDQLGGIATTFGVAGITLDPRTAEQFRQRLQARNQVVQANLRTVADTQQAFVSDKEADAILDAQRGLEFGASFLRYSIADRSFKSGFGHAITEEIGKTFRDLLNSDGVKRKQ